MNLVIQIPCFNEEMFLGETISQLPKALPGMTSIQVLVIDDGSSDKTCEVAQQSKVDKILKLTPHQGLAAAFCRGLEMSLAMGADIVVNLDADNQYRAEDIPRLIAPILRGDADLVIGTRSVTKLKHFTVPKRILHWAGGWVVSAASGTRVSDPTSGFRAFSKKAAEQIRVFNRHTYTVESIIHASTLGLRLYLVPVEVNGPTRESRLIKNLPHYLYHSSRTIVQSTMRYHPFFNR